MGKLIDLTGQRFGRLTVVRIADIKRYKGTTAVLYECLCDCGKTTISHASSLRKGTAKSCGCLRKENASRLKMSHNKHGTRLHRIWLAMKTRCGNPHSTAYTRYGGRGITVCDEWKSDFQCFFNWAMASGYSDDLSIDRIDNDKGYFPDNCRWATKKQQTRNRESSVKCQMDGHEKTLAEWCEIYQLDYNKIRDRIRNGWSVEEALELVPRKKT